MFGRILAFAIVAMSGAAAMAADLKQPTAKWIVDFADAQCVATRNYGSEADPLFLVLKAPIIGETVQLGIVRKGGNLGAKQLSGEIVFNDSITLRTSFLEFGVKSMGQRAHVVTLASKDVANLRQATSLRVRIREKGIERLGTRLGMGLASGEDALAVTQMAPLLDTLARCTADLRRIWHVWNEKDGSPSLKEGPSASLAQLFSGEDYPGIAALKGQAGSVSLVILVDEKGKVADCTVIETSGVAALDAQSCSVISVGAKYKPAIGLDGKSAKSAVFQTINWRLM